KLQTETINLGDKVGSFLFSVCSMSTDEFLVIGPSDPIVAELGGDTILPCSLVPAMNAEDMELRWFRTKFSEAVFVYRNGREQHEEQMPQYAVRTSLVRDLLTHGKAAVYILEVQASDNGSYTCFFQKGGRYAEAILELQVAGLGSAPQVHIEGLEQDGVRMVCKASGWFPKPQVQWTDLSGKKFLEFSEAHAQDAAGLFSVEAALVVRDSSAGSVSCSVLNPILGQEKAMAVSIPGQCCFSSLAGLEVIGPSEPIVAELGGDAILPCSLVPAMNAEDMELRWFRTKFSEPVFIYRNHQEQNRELMPQYAGRTSLLRELLTQGQAAVRIQNVQASDNGMYVCFFKTRSYYEEATLELQVAGLGSAPQVHIEGLEQDGVRVVCKASGWFPKPQVQWTDLSGKKFLEFSEAHAQDAAGLFSVEAALVVRDSSAGSVSCSVLNPILGQEKAMAVSIPGRCCFSFLEGLGRWCRHL
uniref:Ig-like domain-containing protein n=1 Tax=Oryctolagus cuniculus TaxID=9986 RepID=G1TNL5_RABIT